MKYRFEIKEKLPSLNDYTKANRSNVYMANKFKQQIQYDIRRYIGNAPKFINPVILHFIWIEENARRDLDNVAFAKKFILDALVNNNILVDDSQRFVKGFSDEFRRGRSASVIVEIEEINEKKEVYENDNNISQNFIRNYNHNRNCDSNKNFNRYNKRNVKKYYGR